MVHAGSARLAVPEFMAFLEGRPDEERWELVEGTLVMMTPPLLGHQRIASNLERAINNALETLRPDLRADREVGVLVGDKDRYEPEIAIVDEDLSSDERHIKEFYGIVEVLSSTDEKKTSGEPVIDVKVRGYKSCPQNAFVLLVRQDQPHVTLVARTEDGWSTATFEDMDDTLVLPVVGRTCDLWDCYKGTDVARKAKRDLQP